MSATERAQRDRLEQLQAELLVLEPMREAVRLRVVEARGAAQTARARERDAARRYVAALFGTGALTESLMTWRRGALGALRFVLVSVVVLAVFGAVLGTVTYALKAYHDKINQRQVHR